MTETAIPVGAESTETVTTRVETEGTFTETTDTETTETAIPVEKETTETATTRVETETTDTETTETITTETAILVIHILILKGTKIVILEVDTIVIGKDRVLQTTTD